MKIHRGAKAHRGALPAMPDVDRSKLTAGEERAIRDAEIDCLRAAFGLATATMVPGICDAGVAMVRSVERLRALLERAQKRIAAEGSVSARLDPAEEP